MILVYAFSNRWGTNISTRTLVNLQNELKTYSNIIFQKILSYPHQFFNQYVHNKHYSAIIGLGDYYLPLDQIKIETQAQNLYNRHSIIPLAPPFLKLDLPYLNQPLPSQFIFSQNMGQYNCNWLAYQIQSYLNQKNLTSFHLFFHLSPKGQSDVFAKSIANLLINNNLLQ